MESQKTAVRSITSTVCRYLPARATGAPEVVYLQRQGNAKQPTYAMDLRGPEIDEVLGKPTADLIRQAWNAAADKKRIASTGIPIRVTRQVPANFLERVEGKPSIVESNGKSSLITFKTIRYASTFTPGQAVDTPDQVVITDEGAVANAAASAPASASETADELAEAMG